MNADAAEGPPTGAAGGEGALPPTADERLPPVAHLLDGIILAALDRLRAAPELGGWGWGV